MRDKPTARDANNTGGTGQGGKKITAREQADILKIVLFYLKPELHDNRQAVRNKRYYMRIYIILSYLYSPNKWEESSFSPRWSITLTVQSH